MKDKKSSHIGLWLMMALLAVISYFLFMGALKDGVTLNEDNSIISNVESLKDLQDKVYFELDIPSYVSETDEELNIEVVAGQIVSINTTKFVLKASLFVDIKADTLGLYETSEVVEQYNVSNSDILYVKYRQGYVDYPSCTIINWCTSETSYGLMIEDDLTLEESLEIIGINKEQLLDITETDNSIEEDINDDFIEYIIEDKYLIKLPQFKGEVTHVDTAGVSAFFAGDTLLFLVVYNEKDIQNGTYAEQSVVDVRNDIKIYYDSNNTYDNGSDAYDDYELMLLTIDDIAKTIVNK